MNSVRLTSGFWLDEIAKHEKKCFRIEWRTIILGCCSCYKGAGAFLGEPDHPEGYTLFSIEGTDGLQCWLHGDLLKQWRKNGPMAEGGYLFVVQTVGRFRLDFPGGFPEQPVAEAPERHSGF